MRRMPWFLAVVLLASPAFAAYERDDSIRVIPSVLHPDKPVNFQYAYDFSFGFSSFAGTWTAWSGGGKGDSAAISPAEGWTPSDPALRFAFRLEPGGDLWALLNLRPGRLANVNLRPGSGFFFRARTTDVLQVDEYPDKWYVQIRVVDKAGQVLSYRTEDFEILFLWQSFYVSALDFGDERGAGIFAGGAESVRLYDVSLVPDPALVRFADAVLDDFRVWGPGPAVPGVDSDGDGIPDPADGDDDNDGILDEAQSRSRPVVVSRLGYVQGGGRWRGKFTIREREVRRGGTLAVDAAIRMRSPEVARALPALPELVGLLVGERRYDREGRYRSFTNHMISALLTPSGLPIENYQSLVPSRHILPVGGGVGYAAPIDEICRVPGSEVQRTEDEIAVEFSFRVPITDRVPEGHYWLWFEFGVRDGEGNFLRLDSLPFEAWQSGIGIEQQEMNNDENIVFEKKNILPMVRIGDPAPPRMPWALLFNREVHGVKGIVPEEEKGQWALNARNRLGSRPIYPPGDYNLEPGFPDLACPSLNLTYPLDPRSGELSVRVTEPDGAVVDLGSAPFRAMTSWGATTRTGRFLYPFRKYGEHVVRMRGWIRDAYGNRFEGGGTYRLWIAERITFGTFPSLPYEAGQAFLVALEIVPPVPADVSIEIDFFRHSDPARKERFSTAGKANRLGLFAAPKTYVFPCAGEYVSRIEAQYTDAQGRLWRGSLWGAMAVAEKEQTLSAHGRTGYMRNGTTYPTATRFLLAEEGRAENGILHFLFYPHTSGDVLYAASTLDHHNYIFPILTMEFPDRFVPYGGAEGERQIYSVYPTTRSGFSPFCHPEDIDRLAYYFVDAWRPGVSGRHLVGSATVTNSWWPTSPSMFGHQLHVSRNGDLPGDYYRFTGGIVYRDLETGESRHGIYASMCVVTAKGGNRNRVSPPAYEPLFTLNGREHWLFLGGGILPIPGMILEEGSGAPSGGSANPPVPADLETTVLSPSGTTRTCRLHANAIGNFPRAADTVTPLTEPGVWRARQRLSFGGRTGDVLGTRDGEYAFFVIPKDPAKHFYLSLDLAPVTKVAPGQKVVLAGALPEGVSEGVLWFSTVSPGVILEEGSRPATGGRFAYEFDPWETGKKFPFFDTVDFITGRPCLCDTVVFNLFFEGKRADGSPVFGSRVVAMRGDTVIHVTP